ncbi:hypothetical protein HK099_002521 [Clydaea vesicula]|uniref:Uncharacterized protein n=1 Tax=Clydaea vesicula TaxID=447962 RepID=A0AAD5U2D8_9FUNG|nr:hypothetical protein HK099_002521 [Clydaea vesicula]
MNNSTPGNLQKLSDLLIATSMVSLTNGVQFSVSFLGLIFALSNGSSIKAENINFKHTRLLKILLNFISIFNAILYTIFSTFEPQDKACYYLSFIAELTHHALYIIIDYLLLFRMIKIVCDPFSKTLKIQTYICWIILLTRTALTIYALYVLQIITNKLTGLCSFSTPEYLVQIYCYLDISIDIYATSAIVYKLYSYTHRKENNRAMYNVLVTNILRCFIVTILNILPLILDAILNYMTYERVFIKLLTKYNAFYCDTKSWYQKKKDDKTSKHIESEGLGTSGNGDLSTFHSRFFNSSIPAKQNSNDNSTVQTFIDPAKIYEPEWYISSVELEELQSEVEQQGMKDSKVSIPPLPEINNRASL